MKAALIDHDDSFTFNLRHWLFPITPEIQILNHHEIQNQDFKDFSLVVLSPGPKHPEDYPHIMSWLLGGFCDKPIFGVCLGMQLMAAATGANVLPYTPPKHGKISRLLTQDSDLPAEFSGLQVARYHSLACAEMINFQTKATTVEEQIPLWIEHKEKKWLGFQFHPESFLTEKSELLQSYLKTWIHK